MTAPRPSSALDNTRVPLDVQHPERWPHGWSPIRSAEDDAFRDAMNHSEWPEALARVAAGQNPAVVGGDFGLTALHHLCFARYLPESMWRTVLDWGLPVNQLNGDGEPAVLHLIGSVRSSRPWNSRDWAVPEDMTRPLLRALIERGASHGVADSLERHHLPLVLYAALQTKTVEDHLALAFEVLPAAEHARGWAWAFWGAALQREDGAPAHRWLMEHPPVWSQVDWNEVPYRSMAHFGHRPLRYIGGREEHHSTSIALLSRDGLRERFDEVVVQRKVGTHDALHQVLQRWAMSRTDRRENARRARALVNGGASLYGRVVLPNGSVTSPAEAALGLDRDVATLIQRLEPVERSVTARLLRQDANAVRAAMDDPSPRSRPRARL